VKQQVKQSKKDMHQRIKLVQSQPISQSAPTAQGSDVKPVVEKILEEIREKRKQFLDATQAQQQIDQLKGEIQELKKVRVTIKSKSPDKKEDLPASSSSNNPPPPPDPPKVKPTKAPPKPSRRHRPATPEQVEPEVIANEVSGAEEVTTSTTNRSRKRGKSKTKEETIVELKEALADVKKATQAKSEPKARSRTRSQPLPEIVLPIKDDSIVHIDDIVGNRTPSTSTEDKPKKPKRRKHKTLEDVHKAIRDREDLYSVGHRRGVSVGAGKTSKSKNILPHFDVDPRYAIVL